MSQFAGNELLNQADKRQHFAVAQRFGSRASGYAQEYADAAERVEGVLASSGAERVQAEPG